MAFKAAATIVPATPPANNAEAYFDTNDLLRTKVVQPDNHIDILTPMGLRDLNLLDNGGQTVLQRVAAALTNQSFSATLRSYLCADRWWAATGNVTTLQYQQVDTIAAPETNLNARFYTRLKQITNGAKFAYGQAVPVISAVGLWGRTVRLQTKLRYSVLGGGSQVVRLGAVQSTSSATGDAIAGGLASTYFSAWGANGTDPTLGTNLSYIAPVKTESNGTIAGNAVEFALSGSWVRCSMTFVVPSGCVNIIPQVWLKNACTANDDLLIAECGLYLGEEIRDWVEQPFQLEFMRCSRYYQKTFPYGTVPAQSGGVAGSQAVVSGAAASFGGSFDYPQGRMRATPGTLTTYNPSAGNANFRDVTNSADRVVTATNDGDTSVLLVGASGQASATNRIHFTADAEI